MKPTLRKVVPQEEHSFIIRKDVGINMRNNWHYHPEYELLYIKHSTGTWVIGDYVGQFKSGDVILIGPYLPHSFRHDAYIMPKDKKPGEAVVALFQKKIISSPFSELPESKAIINILKLAKKGLKITGKTRLAIGKVMEKIQEKSPGGRFIDLLSVLQTIADQKDYRILASNGFNYASDKTDNAKLNTIFEYTFNYYRDHITLEEVAALVNLTTHSFCRYFKEKTRKTFIQFLMEVRIGNACRLLIEEDISVSEVGYQCGYSSPSHFSHQFKAIKNKSPYEYKQDYLRHFHHQ